MKFLDSLPNPIKSAKWIFNTVFGTEANAEAETEERELENALKNPYNFNLKHIRLLEAAPAEMNAEKKKKINNIAEFHLSLVGTNAEKSFSSRILFAFRSSSLWSFITPGLRQNIEIILSKEHKKVAELAGKDVSSLNYNDLMQMMRVYKNLREKGGKGDSFNKIAEKLVEKAHKILSEYDVLGAGDNLELRSLDLQKKLSTKDKLFILEAIRIFPNEISVQKINKGWKLEDFGKAVVQEFKKNLTDPAKLKNRLEYLPLWELLSDLLDQNELEGLGAEGKSRLKHLISQSQAAQFLNWIEAWQENSREFILLPEHLEALKQIQKDTELAHKRDNEGNLLPGNIEEVLGSKPPEKEGRQKTLEEFLKEWQNEHGVFSVADDSKNMVNLDFAKEVKKFEEAFEAPAKKSAAYKKTINDLEKDISIQQLIGKVDEDVTFSTQWKALTEMGTADNFDSAVETEITKGINTLIEHLEGSMQVAEGTTDGRIQSILGSKDKVYAVIRKLKDLEENLFGREFEAQKKEAEKNLNKQQEGILKQNEEVKRHIELARKIANRGKDSKDAFEAYKEALKSRANSRQLFGADLTVLLESDSEETENLYEGLQSDVLGTNSGELLTSIRNFREKFKTTVLGDLLQNIDQALENPEEFVAWQSKLSDAGILSNRELRDEIDDLKLKLLSAPKEAVSTTTFKEILDAVRNSFRNEILKKVEERFPEGIVSREVQGRVAEILGDKEKNEAVIHFLNHYDRSHRKLYDLDQTHRFSTLQKYRQGKEAPEKFRDNLHQQNNKALKGVTEEQIVATILRESQNLVEKEAVVSAVQHLLERYREIPKNSEESILSELENLIPNFSEAIQNLSPDLRQKLGMELGKMIHRLAINQDANQMADNAINSLTLGDSEVPGLDVLNEMELQVSPFVEETKTLENRFENNISLVNDQLQNTKKVSPEILDKLLFSDFNHFILPRLDAIALDSEKLLKELFPNHHPFIDEYIQNFRRKIDYAKTLFGKFQQTYQNKELESETDLTEISKILLPVSQALDIGNGDMHSQMGQVTEDLKYMPDTLEFLDDKLGLFEPKGKEKAKKNYEKIQDEYQPKVEAYLENAKKLGLMLEKDLKKLSKEEFARIYGMDKFKAAEQLETLKQDAFFMTKTFYGNTASQKLSGETGWENTEISASSGQFIHNEPGFFENNFFENWFEKYENPATQGMAMMHMNFFNRLSSDEYQKLVDKNAKEMQKYLEEVEKCKKPARPWNRLGKWWTGIKWQWFSITDIIEMVKAFKEAYKRKEKRREEEAVAYLGSAIFGETEYGKEFRRHAEEAEDKRVSDYEKMYKEDHFDKWWKVLRKTNNRDEARAMINLLVKEGYMRWNDAGFLRTLNRLQRQQHFDLPEDVQNLPIDKFSEKLESACTAVWTKKIFVDWDGDMQSKREKQMKSNLRQVKILVEAGKIDNTLGDMLKAWRDGDEGVDPAAFEQYLYTVFEDGRSNGKDERRWFYFVLGITLENKNGKTLLDPTQTMMYFSDKLKGSMPYFDFFTERNNGFMKDGRIVPEGTPGAHSGVGGWDYSDRQAWKNFLLDGVDLNFSDDKVIRERSKKFFYQFMVPSPAANTRVEKGSRNFGSKYDHDDAWMLLSNIDYKAMVENFNTKSEGISILSVDFAKDFLSGYKQTFENLYLDLLECEKLYGKINPDGWKVMKEKKLKHIGERMRIAFAAVHTLCGNMHDNASQYPMTLSEKNWESGNGPIESKNFIDGVVQNMLDVSGVNHGDFSTAKDFRGVSYASDYKDISATPEFKRHSPTILKIARDYSMFNNAGAVEKTLQGMFGKTFTGSSVSVQDPWSLEKQKIIAEAPKAKVKIKNSD